MGSLKSLAVTVLFTLANIPCHAANVPAPRAVPASSTLYSAARNEFDAQVVYDMNIYFNLLYKDYFQSYLRSGKCFTFGSDVPLWSELWADAYQSPKPHAKILTCSYRSPGEDVRRDYYYWWTFAYDAMQPAKLLAAHPSHPFMLIGAPRIKCPSNEAVADADVRKNFTPGTVFRDAPQPEPDLLRAPNEMLMLSWKAPADANASARRHAGGDSDGLAFPLEIWFKDPREIKRLQLRANAAGVKNPDCLKSMGRDASYSYQLMQYGMDLDKLPANVHANFDRSIKRGDWGPWVFGELAYCDYKGYLEEIKRFNDRLMQEP